MEAIVDKVVAELEQFRDADSADGGCADLITIESIYWGDPGVLPVNAYPAFTVQPERDEPVSETTGFEVRNNFVTITLLIDAREYFDASVLEATGDRMMVKTMSNLRRWLRRSANRRLDDMEGVREVTVSATDYLVQVRDSVMAKSAQVSLTVNRQYSRQA